MLLDTVFVTNEIRFHTSRKGEELLYSESNCASSQSGWFMQGREKKESRLQLTKRAGTTKEVMTTAIYCRISWRANIRNSALPCMCTSNLPGTDPLAPVRSVEQFLQAVENLGELAGKVLKMRHSCNRSPVPRWIEARRQ